MGSSVWILSIEIKSWFQKHWNLIAGETETGDPWSSLASQTIWISKIQMQWETLSFIKNKSWRNGWRRHLILTSDLYSHECPCIHVGMHTWIHTYLHEHIQATAKKWQKTASRDLDMQLPIGAERSLVLGCVDCVRFRRVAGHKTGTITREARWVWHAKKSVWRRAVQVGNASWRKYT